MGGRTRGGRPSGSGEMGGKFFSIYSYLDLGI
jgi:hypothetical protein